MFSTFFQLLLNFFSPFFNFQNWPLGGATYISCKFDQQVGLLASVANLAIRWPCLHPLQIWPPGGATCIATLPWIALLASSVCIELVSSSARVTSVKSQKGLVCMYLKRLGPIDRTPGIPGSDKHSVIPCFYRAQVSLGSDLWVLMSVRQSQTMC